jgi:hypothetical protein
LNDVRICISACSEQGRCALPMKLNRKIRHRDSNYRKERWAAFRVAQGQAAVYVMRLRSAFWDHKMGAQPPWL